MITNILAPYFFAVTFSFFIFLIKNSYPNEFYNEDSVFILFNIFFHLKTYNLLLNRTILFEIFCERDSVEVIIIFQYINQFFFNIIFYVNSGGIKIFLFSHGDEYFFQLLKSYPCFVFIAELDLQDQEEYLCLDSLPYCVLDKVGW